MATLPVTSIARELRIDPPLSDEEFAAMCASSDMRLERTREGVIVVNAPAGLTTGDGNSEINHQLRAWWKKHRRGRVFESSAGFTLPDSSILSPDASYLSPERLKGVTPRDYRGFAHVCPDFVIELVSPSDSLPEAKAKMERWLENGVLLGWLVYPPDEVVFIYRPGANVAVDPSKTLVGTGPVEGFELDTAAIWECY